MCQLEVNFDILNNFGVIDCTEFCNFIKQDGMMKSETNQFIKSEIVNII